VAGQAQTGTGKTAAFLVALYSRILRSEVPPTRKYQRPARADHPRRRANSRCRSTTTPRSWARIHASGSPRVGGVDYEKQRRDLEEGVDILIGTPGRLIHFYKQRVFDLASLQVLVLDEADRMFDLASSPTSGTSCGACRHRPSA